MSRILASTSCLVLVALLVCAGDLHAASDNSKQGSPEIKSAGPLAFGPEGVLFIADPKGATIYAVQTDDDSVMPKQEVALEKIDAKIAGMLGTTPDDILINDIAAHPESGNVYLSVSRGRGPDSQPVIMKALPGGEVKEFPLSDVYYSQASMPNPPADETVGEGRRRGNLRTESITDLAFVDGRLYVAGLSNEEFSSQFHSFAYPFEDVEAGTSVEIFHGSHGRFETRSPIRTFTTYKIDDAPHLLAAYTCTPLVKIPIAMLRPGEKVTGDTVAELGNHNRPLDMIIYSKDGADYVLMANNARGLMKIAMASVGEIAPIVDRVPEKAGLEYETIESAEGVVQLDQLDNTRAVVLIQNDAGINLQTMQLP